MGIVSRGFQGRRQADVVEGRLPPGQYLRGTSRCSPPVRRPAHRSIAGRSRSGGRWTSRGRGPGRSSSHCRRRPRTLDIHCVTKWSKLDTAWRGVPVETLLEEVETVAEYALAFCDGGYTMNLPLEDLVNGKAWVAYEYAGEPLAPEHGGPARLLVPHLYFWKSAKWLRGLELLDGNEPGFWESAGYHIYGDPWRQQRYAGD